jgi:hypothetical protein
LLGGTAGSARTDKLIDASIKGQENADWARNGPPRLKPALIFDVLSSTETPLLRVMCTWWSVPLSFHDVGLWIGVDKMLAPFRETVKI